MTAPSAAPKFHAGLLHPRYALVWLGFGLWWLLAQLPYGWQMRLGAGLGWLLHRLAKRRVAIAARNIALCFGHLSAQEQARLVAATLDSIGKAFFETGISWFMPVRRLRRLFTLEGLDQVQAAEARGQGVILLGLHFTHIDMGGAILCQSHLLDGSYRRHANPVYDYVQRRGRERHNPTSVAIPREDVRRMVRTLKNGRTIWYAPDQDYGAEHSVFAPFFGVPAATVTATARLARMGKACVMPYTHYRRPDGLGYIAKIGPPLDEFPSGDDLADALRVNQVAEAGIQVAPEQYLWVHRRFKTRPPGQPDLYRSAGIAKGSRG